MTKVLDRVVRVGLAAAWLCLAIAPSSLLGQSTLQVEASPPKTGSSAENLYFQLRNVGLDKDRVYRIRNAALDRAAIHITLDDGTIAFTQNVLGRVTGAFFEGDGEILLIPPNQVERASMALFTGAAILEERFVSAYFRFNDQTYQELRPFLSPADNAQEFVSQWDQTARNLAQMHGLRLLLTFSQFLPDASGKAAESAGDAVQDRMFHARMQGVKLGGFDVDYDSQAFEQVWAGQLKAVEGGTYFDLWTSFSIKTAAKGQQNVSSITGQESHPEGIEITNYKIKAQVTPPRELDAEAEVDVQVRKGGERALMFELSRFLNVKQVEADGVPVEFVHNPAIEGTQISRRGNDLLALVFPQALRSGQKLHLHFVYGGDVLSEAGSGLLYVGARGTWYPNRGIAMSNFNMEFRYPPGWTLVATGKRTEPPATSDQGLAGEQVSRWVSERPIPVAGFNLGKYTRAVSQAGNVKVEVYAASGVERNFPRPAPQVVIPDLPTRPGTQKPIIEITPPPPSPARNAQNVAAEASRAIEFFAQRFGAYPFSDLELTQMPGPLSQGWPGLVFLSSYSFLTPEERAQLHLSPVDITISEGVIAHETAHQWWGDLIGWSSYRDQWLSEALANYSSLMLLESTDPAKFHAVMDKYRDDLLLKNKEGELLMDAGPVTLGSRLSSSHFPAGYEAISYGRGTWLFHMLRNMMRDAERKPARAGASEEPFVRALRKIVERYQGKAVTSAEVFHVFAEELPPSLWYEGDKSLDWFYRGWVNGTAVPRLETQGVKFSENEGKRVVTGKVQQKSAPKDLVTVVPVYAATTAKMVLLGQVFADGPETSFRFTVPAGTRKVILDPYQTVLTRPR